MKYHSDIFMPDNIKNAQIATMLKYTHHAKQEAEKDRISNLPRVLDTREMNLIEAVVEEDKFIKGVYRGALDAARDISLVVDMDTGVVITVWANNKDDTHDTLDWSQYDTHVG